MMNSSVCHGLLLLLSMLVSKSRSYWLLNNQVLASGTQIMQNDGTLLEQKTKKIEALLELASIGAELGVNECEHQFRYETWNCPRTSFKAINNPLERRSGRNAIPWARMREKEVNKEIAFIHAITSAGVAYSVIRNCSKGSTEECKCDQKYRNKKKGWKWGGCSDNFSFGDRVSRLFLDNAEPGTSLKSLANLHNIQAGRVAVQRKMRRLCKCHGVSGSCAAQTCWKQLSEFRSIGDRLKKMYKKATRIRADDDLVDDSSNRLSNRVGEFEEGNKESSRRRRLSNGRSVGGFRSRKIKKRELVYLQDSPDYCRRNPITGDDGVLGRTCSTEPDNPESKIRVRDCKNMCRRCGYRIQRNAIEVHTSCKCRFQWCCTVACQTCKKKKVEITCV